MPCAFSSGILLSSSDSYSQMSTRDSSFVPLTGSVLATGQCGHLRSVKQPHIRAGPCTDSGCVAAPVPQRHPAAIPAGAHCVKLMPHAVSHIHKTCDPAICELSLPHHVALSTCPGSSHKDWLGCFELPWELTRMSGILEPCWLSCCPSANRVIDKAAPHAHLVCGSMTGSTRVRAGGTHECHEQCQ